MQNLTQAEIERQFAEVFDRFGISMAMGNRGPLDAGMGTDGDRASAQAKLSGESQCELTCIKKTEYGHVIVTRTSSSVAEALMSIYMGIPSIILTCDPAGAAMYDELRQCVGKVITSYIESNKPQKPVRMARGITEK